METDWIRVTVHSAATREAVLERGPGRFDVWVKAKPVEGRANAAVLDALARHLGIPAARLRIVRGHRSRQKWVARRGDD